MLIKQLVNLYILQKDHHQEPLNKEKKRIFEEEYNRLLDDSSISKNQHLAPPLFKGQPNIPFVLFLPKTANAENPAPLIIHTHGGPAVHVNLNLFHAEIAYFLSQGYVVACPNYRGSKGGHCLPENEEQYKEELSAWNNWEIKSEGKHHIYGPEDVYTVTKYMAQMDYVDSNKIFLRGCSYGSFINAHLLAGVQKGKFESIFKGAHLSGGVKYPVASVMPDDIPLLITHSVNDEIAPFADARIFMEKMLLKQLSLELSGSCPDNIQIFVAPHGNHHLINPALKSGDEDSVSAQELAAYLGHTTQFIEALNKGEKYHVTDTYDQFKEVMENIKENSEVLRRVYAYRWMHNDNRFLKSDSSKEEHSQQFMETPLPPLESREYHGPTMALLKLQLGDEYTGEIKTDLVNYLKTHFNPVDWKNPQIHITDAGKRILDNVEFVDQMVLAITKEEAFLKEHPNHMVLYHTAENYCLQLYTFINLWQAMLAGKEVTTLQVIEEMRLYDFMKNSFDDIEVFLIKMRRLASAQTTFNYAPGFSERAIACNPTLISNSHSTASSSLWWHFNVEENKRAPVAQVIGDMLKVLGIYSLERMNRYLQLFERERQSLVDMPQSLFQQIFIPYDQAEKAAYTCQIWGEEFAKNDMKLKSPAIIRELIEDPVLFENDLRRNKGAITNFTNSDGFGDIDHGFNYADVLQLRYLPRTNSEIVTNSYFRSVEAHENLVFELIKLIREDFGDYLAYGAKLPDFILKDADKTKQLAYNQSGLRFFPPNNNANYKALYLQQLELYKGLIQNPCKESYGEIISLDEATKLKLQEKLKKNAGEGTARCVFPYSLCLYLKGYTYYDLLKEAASAMLLTETSDPRIALACEENFSLVMEMIDSFSIPSSTMSVPMCGEMYNRLYGLMQYGVNKYQYNPDKHDFIQPQKGTCYEDYLFGLELSNAVTCVLKHARLAKEKNYGHDISSRILSLY